MTQIRTANLPATVNFSYDSDGNLLNDGLRTFEYDGADRLTAVTQTNAWRAEYTYDAFARRRISKQYGWTGSSWSATNEIHYVCDGMLVMQERNSANQPAVTYTRGPDLSGSVQGAGGIGGLLARTDANGAAFYHADGNGNITTLINAGGVPKAKYVYDPFGNVLGMSGPLAGPNMYRFSSKEVEPLGGQVYYGLRFYDPNIQKWLNRDPLGEAGGFNRYRFDYNNPLSFIDPDGMAPRLTSVTFDLGGGQASVGYVNQQFGQNYGMGLHGPLDLRNSPPGRLLELLGRMQKPLDDAERWLKDSGNPFTRGVGGLLAGLQWFFPGGKAGKVCKLERYGSEAEAAASEAANKLLPRLGHENQPKWVGLEGTIDPRTLGKPKNYTDKMNIEMKQDVGEWLRQNAISKDNEPGRFGIPADKLDEFNEIIEKITSSER